MATADISGLLYFMPIFTFLFVFIVVYAILSKVKEDIGTNEFVNALASFLIATMFVTVSSMRMYMESVVPWVVILLLALFFVLVVVGFSQNKIDNLLGKNFAIGFVIVLLLIFFFSGVKVFSSVLSSLFSPLISKVTNDDRLFGSILIFAVAAMTSWLVTKK